MIAARDADQIAALRKALCDMWCVDANMRVGQCIEQTDRECECGAKAAIAATSAQPSGGAVCKTCGGRGNWIEYVDGQPVAEFPCPDCQPSGRGDALADLVSSFSAALLEKLQASEAKYSWQNGWLRDDWADDLREKIRHHIEKGDPRDVAAYCAFAWHHGWSLAQPIGGAYGSDITGEMWVAGKREFDKYAERYAAAKTTKECTVISDVAPAEIFKAMRTARPSGGTADAEECRHGVPQHENCPKCARENDYR